MTSPSPSGSAPSDDPAASSSTTPTTWATPALQVLQEACVAHVVRPYEHVGNSPLGFGMEVATALGVDPDRVFKTMLATADHEVLVAVVPVSGRLDLRALARAVGAKKASMAERSLAEKATGYLPGGISPFGQTSRLRTVVDVSALDHDTIIVSAGRRGLQVELSPADLIALTGATAAPVAQA